jgi:hypothetical protein
MRFYTSYTKALVNLCSHAKTYALLCRFYAYFVQVAEKSFDKLTKRSS